MTPSPGNREQRLERALQETLRNLPPRPAPASLEDRVLAEIARRAALPWWRKSYAHWPVAARAAFLLVSGGVAKLVLMVVAWAQADFQSAAFTSAFGPLILRVREAIDLADSLVDFCWAAIQSIPPLWLYGGLGAIALMYVMLFGVGAFAYRTLYARR